MRARHEERQNVSERNPTITPPGQILIVDDEDSIRAILSRLVVAEGHRAVTAPDGQTALDLLQRDPPDAVLLDIRMPGIDGMEVLSRIRKLDPDLPVIVVTGSALMATDAVAALRAGAYDYLVKPFDHIDIVHVVRSALRARRAGRAARNLSMQTQEASRLEDLMGPSEAILEMSASVARVARSEFTVFITGETGSGKEIVAQAIHEASRRASGPFVAVDCGAIPETLFESELFGHEKGAFTGASHSTPGHFEAATGGSLFLDEISNMPLGCQAKLLRALQEKRIMRVGSTKTTRVDARVLVAANEDPEIAVKRGFLRHDLFFRLNEFAIRVPPLRERRQDVLFLAKRFLDLANKELGKNVKGLSESAVELLLTYQWPGNVRELRSTVRRAVLLADSGIDAEHLRLPEDPGGFPVSPDALDATGEGISLKELARHAASGVERSALIDTLRRTGGNKAAAARLLQIDYKTMHTKLKQYGIGGREGNGSADEQREQKQKQKQKQQKEEE